MLQALNKTIILSATSPRQLETTAIYLKSKTADLDNVSARNDSEGRSWSGVPGVRVHGLTKNDCLQPNIGVIGNFINYVFAFSCHALKLSSAKGK